MEIANDNQTNLEYLAGVQLSKRKIRKEKILNVNRQQTKEERVIQWFQVVACTMRTLEQEWRTIQEMD